MQDFLVGISPRSSSKVSAATNGLYEGVVVGVLATSPNLVPTTFRHTLISSLKTLGWDPNQPDLGVLIRLFGTQETIKRMSYILQDFQVPISHSYIYHAPLSAEYYQYLDHEFNNITHLICFHDRNQPVNLAIRQLANNHWVGVLDVVNDW